MLAERVQRPWELAWGSDEVKAALVDVGDVVPRGGYHTKHVRARRAPAGTSGSGNRLA